MTPETETIRFYSVQGEFGEFSNFAPFRIKVDGKVWPTVEHYFQAHKTLDPKRREKIRQVGSPAMAARMGRDRKVKIRRDWESAKVDVMRKAVLAKFNQHQDLRELLESTGNARLVEHTENDNYWGDGGDGGGRNMLGRILMKVRADLRLDG